MASLYDIKESILRIFNEVEVNEGEITEEQYSDLCIKQEELKEKLDAYVKAIKEWESDADFCKKEKAAINNRQNVYKNRVERLKEAALDAVIKFGEHSKTNMFIELPTCRLFTRKSTSVEIDKHRINVLICKLVEFLNEVNANGVVVLGNDVDMQGIIDSINANCKAEYGEDFKPFTVHDLVCVRVNISYEDSIYNLLLDEKAFDMYLSDSIHKNISDATDKTYVKDIQYNFGINSTVCKTVENLSLQIK